jgi:ferredoxin, 2Fe-2S
MPRVIFHDIDGHRIEAEVAAGNTAMEAALDNNVAGILAECGGACACATCHCYVDEAWLSTFPSPKPEELEMLEFAKAEFRSNSRLSCQLKIADRHDGLVVRLPDLQ